MASLVLSRILIWKTEYTSDSFPSLEENPKNTTTHLEDNAEAEDEEEDEPSRMKIYERMEKKNM